MTKDQLLAVCEASIKGGETAAAKQMKLYVDSASRGGDTGYPYSYAWKLIRNAPVNATMDYFKREVGTDTESDQIKKVIDHGTNSLEGKFHNPEVHTYDPVKEDEAHNDEIANLINKDTIFMLEHPNDKKYELLQQLRSGNL